MKWASLLVLLAAGACGQQITSTVFGPTEGGYHTINNPSIVWLAPGKLLVFAEARLGSGGDGDSSRIGIKQSADNGQSWGPMRSLLPEGVHPASTVSNLAGFVIDGSVHLVFSLNNTFVNKIVSRDSGAHWSAPVDLTASAKLPGEGWVATGPANAVVLRSGRVLVPIDTNLAAGSISIDFQLVPGSQGRNRQCPMARLAVGVRGAPPTELPALHTGSGNVDPSVRPGSPQPAIDPCASLNLANLFKLSQRAYVLISDDGGETFHRSSALPLVASETAVAELGGGRVLARSRLAEAGWQDGCQHFALSRDNGSTWESLHSSNCTEDPGVQNSMLPSPANDGSVFLASPRIEKRCGDHLRGNLTLYRSEDGGVGWEVASVVHADCSGYSSMVSLDDKHVGVVFSTAGLPGGGPVFFRSIQVA